MKPRHQVSRAAIVLIKRFEGFRAKAAQLDDGRWTIGYGHTKTARAGAQVSEADAEALLLYDLIGVSHAVNEWTFAPLNQNEFDALVCFAFNIGLENFHHSSTLRRLNEGRMLEAAMAMELWRKADFEGERIVIDALVRRRAVEKSLFLEPVDGWAPAPSPVLPPKLDYDVAAVLPNQRPSVVRTELAGERAVPKQDRPRAFVPLDGDDADAPTASETAAKAVSARLEALLAQTEPPADAFAAENAATTSDAAEDLPFPDEAPRDIDEPAATPPHERAIAEDSRDSGEIAPAEAPATGAAPLFPRKRAAERFSPERLGLAWLAALAVLGLALFASAVTWGFDTVGPLGGPVAGLGLGVLGVACFGAAVYLFLLRIGGRGGVADDQG